MPRLNESQQAERRERLLDAAERCFARSGFHAATMADIARAARVSAGAAYIYFGSKEELIAGIAERDRQRIATDFAAIGDAPDFADALSRCARHYLLEEPDFKRQLMVEMAAESARNPAVAKSCRSVDRALRESFRRALARQVASGRIAPVLPIDDAVQIIMILGDGMFQRSATDPDFDAARVVDSVIAMVRRMLGIAAAPRARRREGRAARCAA